MQRERSACCLVVLCLCIAIPAVAQWEVAGYIGSAFTQNSDLTLRQPSLRTNLRFGNISYRGESFQSPVYYGVRGGYTFRPHWAGEIEFTHLKVFANVNQSVPINGTLNGAPVSTRQPMNTIIQGFGISHGVNLLMGHIVFRQPLWRPAPRHAQGRLILTFRLGAGTTIPHAETIIEGHANEHYQIGSPVIQLGGGVELSVWRKLHWMGEYKYTRTDEQVNVYSGNATTLLQSHHVITGPVIEF
jgi:hypothetical protein